MKMLEERIRKDGIVREGNVLKVDSFINHQMDIPLFREMAKEWKRLFAGKTIKVRYRTNSDAEYSEAEATVAEDGSTFTATVPALGARVYEVALVANLMETDYTSASVNVTMPGVGPFYFTLSEYDAHFDESFTPELVFATDEYTLNDVEFVSSNTDVASVVKRTGKVSVKRTAGDAVITAQLKSNTDIKTEITVHAALRNAVQDIVLGDGTKTINLTYLDILALAPTVVPENADIQSYDIAISNTDIATTHSVRAFNPSRQYYELVTHQVGECDVTFKSQDGSGVESTYHIIVNGPDRTPMADNYQDGTLWLNEEWFGHTNGSINYITKDKDIKYRVYESQNPYQSFGATSQYGMIYGGKLIVMSKQHDDGGDPRQGGGRVVVADAKTLKKLAAFDYIGADIRPSGEPDGLGDGDGRACVGVNENKVYLGSTTGIQALDLNTLTLGNIVSGIDLGSNAYNGQIGDMVAVEASPGHDIGEVAMVGPLVPLQVRKASLKRESEIKRIFRKARQSDLEKFEEAKSRELDTMICSRRIAADLGLDMKIGDVEYQGDGNKAIFYYIADERVDFRQLIKVLAETFHVRIEMKQIGARQEAGRIGGTGPCGRELCCATWMKNFVSVSTNAARIQDISLNPQKLAGMCAKLKCCLNYEADDYVEARRKLPSKEIVLQTKDSDYYLVKSDILTGLVTYSTDKNTMSNVETISFDRAHEIINMNKRGEKPLSLTNDGKPKRDNRPADLLAEADISRFDKSKKKKKNNNSRNRNNKQANGANKTQNNAANAKRKDNSKEPAKQQKKGAPAAKQQ